ncbi:hypothetical protein KCP74_00875 [Salmonella enterica subsp. enterica]|nr:hypothetical protein KCP74_00875 [Salmonella enterica subsp. enterica]
MLLIGCLNYCNAGAHIKWKWHVASRTISCSSSFRQSAGICALRVVAASFCREIINDLGLVRRWR